MTNKRGLVIAIFLAVIISIPSVISMGYGKTEDAFIIFQPGYQRTYDYVIIPTSGTYLNYTIELKKNLSQYLSTEPEKAFYNVAPDARPPLKVHVNIPEDAPYPEPGLYKPRVLISEATATGGNDFIAVKTGAAIEIKMLVLYDGKYLSQENMILPSVGPNESITTNITFFNYGKEKINSVNARIDIYHKDELVTSFNTNTISADYIEGKQSISGTSSQGLESGNYRVVATINWDGQTTTIERTLRVGELKININDYTKEVPADTISEFKVNIESFWNNELQNVYAIVKIGEKKFQTPSSTLYAWQKKELSLYLDSKGLSGEQPVEISIMINGKVIKKENGVINIVSREQTTNTNNQKKEPENKTTTQDIMIVLGIVVVVLVLFNLYLMMKKKKS